MQLRNSITITTSIVIPILLQCGRGISAAELAANPPIKIQEFVLQCGRGISAAEFSMRTAISTTAAQLQWGRGISAAELWNRLRTLTNYRLLQWGRGISAAELWNRLRTLTNYRLLQWGRGISAAELLGDCGLWSFCWPASMGPRHFSRGTRRRRLHLIFQLDCFNGAAAFQPRNCRGLLSVCHHSISSMGPRHFSRGTRLVSPRMTWWNGSSMRPRHFSRGTPVRVFDHTNRYLHPFNYGRRALVPFAVQFAVLQ